MVTKDLPKNTDRAGDGPEGAPSAALVAPYTMHEEYGKRLKLLLAWVFRPIHYPAACAERLRGLSQEGVLVYVTRGHSTWLPLCFNYVLSRIGLPLARFVGGVRFFWWQPPGHMWRYFKQRRTPVHGPWEQTALTPPLSRREALLAKFCMAGKPSFIVLPVPRSDRGFYPDLNDYIRALIVAQRATDKPIMLAPHILVDREQSGAAHQTVIDRMFGDRRRPGGLRHLAMLLTLRHGTLRMADPINLKTFLQEHAETDERILARKVRYELHRRMSEEERVVAGPRLTEYETTARHVLRDSVVRTTIADVAAKTGQTDPVLEEKAQDDLRSIAARYNVRFIKTLDHVLHWIFNRIYDGIAVDEAGLSRVIETSRRGPVVFCPSHRSHVDYLVLSYVLWRHGITPPHIAAGANLSFFPLGNIFRNCGAFFLRRTFRDDPIYQAVFSAYLMELIKTGTSLEFFPEGTRSRSGKLLLPKFGMLAMLAEAWRRDARDDIQFVPVSIDYERIIESHSYERELRGAEKKAEDIGGLLRTTSVLRSRYGRVQLQFGDPISLAALAAQKGLPQDMSAEFEAPWRREVERLGFRILHQVAMVCSVTPTALVSTALLGHPGRGMAQGMLLERVNSLVEFLEGAAARLSNSLNNADTRVSAVLEAVQKLVDEGVVSLDRAGRSDMEPIYRVPDETRVILDFHKNAVMNYFAPAALVARAIRKRGMANAQDYKDLHADTRFLSRLFKKEFIYRVDSDYNTYFDESLGSLAVRGFLDVHDDGTVHLRNQAAITHLAGLLDSFVQGYWVTARTLMDLRAFPLWQKEFVTRTLERARRAFLEGDITRPESGNRTLIETALSWMLEAKVVETHTEGKRKTLQLAESFGADKLQQLIDEIQLYL